MIFTRAQAHVAAAYNAGQTRTEEDARAFALAGISGEGTDLARAIAAFQASHGLTPDGKAGPATMAALRARVPAAKSTIARIGAWAMRSAVLSPDDDLQRAVDLGLTDVSLCVHGSGGPFKPFVTATRFAAIARMCAAAGITPHAMFWPRPDLRHAGQVLDYLRDVLSAGGPLGSADLDAEGPWCNAPSLERWGQATAEHYRDHWPDGLPLVVNAITRELDDAKTQAPNDGPLAPLVAVADVVIPQAYTSTKKGQGGLPGERQTKVISLWREAAPHAELVLGLAAYSQEGAGGFSAQEAMSRAWDAAESAGVAAVRYWDLGALAQGAPRLFVTARCAELRSRNPRG